MQTQRPERVTALAVDVCSLTLVIDRSVLSHGAVFRSDFLSGAAGHPKPADATLSSLVNYGERKYLRGCVLRVSFPDPVVESVPFVLRAASGASPSDSDGLRKVPRFRSIPSI